MVWPSALMSCAVLRYASYSAIGTVLVAGGCRGRRAASPSGVWSWVRSSLDSGTPLGFKGPTRPLNSDSPLRPDCALSRTDPLSQTEAGNLRSTALRPAFDDGKWVSRRAAPSPESVPAGAPVEKPKP